MVKPRKPRCSEPALRVHWVRCKFARPKGRKLRVIVYARFSTDEQNPRSIEDQVQLCKKFLFSLGLKEEELEIIVIFDEAVSGERLLRDGIDEVRRKINEGWADLVIGEDAGRFFRHTSACIEFVETAVDAGVRIICINDAVDTADEDYWEDRLYEAARHHAKSNKFTSRRIERALAGLWENGYAIGLLKPGYRRKLVEKADQGVEPEDGPKVDEIDPELSAIIHEIFERVAANESCESIADWLTSISFPKTSNSLTSKWSSRNVIALIRREDYRGVQTYRNTQQEKKRRTGRGRSKQRAQEEVWRREMPHLRIVPDWLWTAANKAIDARVRGKRLPGGDGHPLANIPRNSRGPCSDVFVCGICQAKMHLSVRSEGGYRCSAADDRACWNRATCLRRFTDQPIGDAIINRLHDLGPKLDRLLERCADVLGDQMDHDARRSKLTTEIQELEAIIRLLNDRLESVDEPPASTLERIMHRENELFEKKSELEGLAAESRNLAPPTKKEVQDRIAYLVARFSSMNRDARNDLKTLVGRIRAVPHVQFATDKIILRARFEIRLGALLPTRTRATLAGLFHDPDWSRFESIPVEIELCELSTGPKYGVKAFEMSKELGPTAIGKRLGISKRNACLATDYGKKMQIAGVTDPFAELTSEPEKASRWRPRKPK